MNHDTHIVSSASLLIIKLKFPSILVAMVPFPILLLIFIYLVCYERRNLHAGCLLFYVFSLSAHQMTWIIVQLLLVEPGNLCAITGFILHFTSIMNSVSLLILSYDVWSAYK
jgi:hypothetical protein